MTPILNLTIPPVASIFSCTVEISTREFPNPDLAIGFKVLVNSQNYRQWIILSEYLGPVQHNTEQFYQFKGTLIYDTIR